MAKRTSKPTSKRQQKPKPIPLTSLVSPLIDEDEADDINGAMAGPKPLYYPNDRFTNPS
jgi:hypothetical protein